MIDNRRKESSAELLEIDVFLLDQAGLLDAKVTQQIANQLGPLGGIAAAPCAALDLDVWPRMRMIDQLVDIDREILALVENPPAPAALLNRGNTIRLEV